MNVPSASMRLQLHQGLTFDDAVSLIPYFANLGISHINVSPILTARAGSRHGEDIVDPSTVNPELGGEEGFGRLVAALRQARLGIIVDIAPGQMAAASDNLWWQDILQHGRKSTYAHYFDIDWEPDDPALKDKILLPVLAKPYGEALRDGEISLAFNDAQDRYEIHYLHHVFPLDPEQRPRIEQNAPDAFDSRSFGGRVRLQALLELQHFRLAAVRSASDAINWRRLGSNNDLVALRVEEENVFDATHATILRLFADGMIDGVCIRHIDNLADPKGYCQRLRALLGMLANNASGERPYIIVDKVLNPGEELASDWDCDGTSRGDLDRLAYVLHDRSGAEPLAQWWAALSARPAVFAAEMESCRRAALDGDFAAQLDAAAAALHRLALQDPMARDLARPALRRSLAEILAHLPVHRTYVGLRGGSASDKKALGDAVAKAMTTCLPRDRETIRQIAAWLGGEARTVGDAASHRDAIRRFQQLSAALGTKAEDMAFYRHAPLLSYGDRDESADAIDSFHQQAIRRAAHFPHALQASAAPNVKFGEDVRARLAVLSEMSQDWAETLSDWLNDAEPLFAHIDGARAPSFADAATLFQMLVGAWPLGLKAGDTEGLRSFASRMALWQLKALRVAELATDAIAPNDDYEAAALNFLWRLFEHGWPAKIATFADRVAPAGAVNGLTQTLLKLTVPGVPDIYQGTEFWDQSLADPDIRPVDFDARARSLSARKNTAALAPDWQNGEIKQALIQDVLAARRGHFDLFAEGNYVPLQVEGAQADHVIAFARRRGEEAAIVIASRLTAARLSDGILVPGSSWDDTHLHLPASFAQLKWRSLFANKSVTLRGEHAPLGELLDGFPVALLMSAK